MVANAYCERHVDAVCMSKASIRDVGVAPTESFIFRGDPAHS